MYVGWAGPLAAPLPSTLWLPPALPLTEQATLLKLLQRAVMNWWNANRRDVPRTVVMYLSGQRGVKDVVSLLLECSTLAGRRHWATVVPPSRCAGAGDVLLRRAG